jgi:hypothetical protein
MVNTNEYHHNWWTYLWYHWLFQPDPCASKAFCRGLTASVARQETKSVWQHRREETQLVDVECDCGREALVMVDVDFKWVFGCVDRMFDFLPSRGCCHISTIWTSTLLPTTIIAHHYSGQPWPTSATTRPILVHAALDCLFCLHMQALSTLGPWQLPPCCVADVLVQVDLMGSNLVVNSKECLVLVGEGFVMK